MFTLGALLAVAGVVILSMSFSKKLPEVEVWDEVGALRRYAKSS